MATRPILIGGNTGAGLSDFAPEPVLLAVLKASGIPVEWYEGVAIVQEVSRHLLDSPPIHQPGSGVSVTAVSIDMTGTVIVSGNAVPDGASAVSQLGALLRDLLPDNMPVPLRLAVSQAMSNPPHYASITSFSDALSYFERPDRRGIIRALYKRWEVNTSGRPAPQSHVEPVSESQPAAEKPARQESPTAAAAMPRWIVVAGSIGLVITLGLILLAAWARNSNPPTIDRPTESSAPSSDPSTNAAALEAPLPEVDRSNTTNQGSVPPPVTTTARNQNMRVESVPSKQAAAPIPLTTSGEATDPLEESRRPTDQPNAVASQTARSVTVLETATESHIYSALDAEVAAPVAAYPQSATVATVMHDDEMLLFDVIIGATGKVESVKLQRAPSSIRSTLMLTMSLSVAKAWRFQPATRHGQTVRYRQSFAVPAP